MANSLRAKIKKLHHDGKISAEECVELLEKLDGHDKEVYKERYKKQIQNLIDNESFEIVNPFNTYEYTRVVRVADLYDLMEVNADEV